MQTPHRLGCRPASSVAGRTSAVRHLACPHLRQSHAHGTGFPHHQAPNHRRSRTAPARRLLSTYNCVGRHCAPFRRSARRAAICRCAGSLPTESLRHDRSSAPRHTGHQKWIQSIAIHVDLTQRIDQSARQHEAQHSRADAHPSRRRADRHRLHHSSSPPSRRKAEAPTLQKASAIAHQSRKSAPGNASPRACFFNELA